MHEKKILKILHMNIYHPGNQLTAIFDQPLKTRAFSNQNKGHLGSRKICTGSNHHLILGGYKH